MKKNLIIAAAMAVSLTAMPICSADAAENDELSVYVTIADKDGKLALAQEKIAVSDADGDGDITINDALYIAHEEKFDGGAAKGYASSQTDYGLSMDMLWGEENGGSYGYYVNNESSMSLADKVSDGDYVNAFVYTDLEAWSDKYCWFDIASKDAVQGDEVTLTLFCSDYDENWNPVKTPVEDAVITVNGSDSGVRTNADGKAVIKLENDGENLISASSDKLVLVPPVCKINVEKAEEKPTETTAPEEESTTVTTVTEETTEEKTEPVSSEEKEEEKSEETTEAKAPEKEKPETSTEKAPAKTEKPASSASGTSSPVTGDSGVGAVLAFAALMAGAAFISKKNK